MGKTAFNPLSQWRGRVGGQVYKVVNGKQVVMPYKPVERKGGTVSQLVTRAKFALAGKFSKITPSEILRGINGSKVDRRSIFVKSITRKATVSIDGDAVKADIAPADIVFSEGLVTMLNIGGSLTVNGDFDGTYTEVPDDIDAVLTIAVCENADNEYDRIVYQVSQVNHETNQASVAISTGVAQGQHVRIYYVPLTVTDQARSFLSSSDFDEHGTDEYTLTMLLTSVEGAYKWQRSQFFNTLVFTQG